MSVAISVIIPVYNLEKFIGRCLESIVSCVVDCIEVLVIDDGSTDNGGMIAEAYSKQYRYIKYIHTENKGVSAARNLGISLSKGKWIFFVDGDDYVPDNTFELLLKELREDVDILVGDYYVEEGKNITSENSFAGDGGVISQSAPKNMYDILIGEKKKHANIGVPWAKLYRREFLVDNNVFFPVGLKRMQDSIFNLYAFYQSHKVYYSKQYFYCYCKRENSSVHKYSPDFDKTIIEILTQVDTFINHFGIEKKNVEKIINTKKALLFIEWCRLVPCHKNCNWPLSVKREKLAEEKRKLLLQARPFYIKSVSLSKLMVIMLFYINADVCGLFLIKMREIIRE